MRAGDDDDSVSDAEAPPPVASAALATTLETQLGEAEVNAKSQQLEEQEKEASLSESDVTAVRDDGNAREHEVVDVQVPSGAATGTDTELPPPAPLLSPPLSPSSSTEQRADDDAWSSSRKSGRRTNSARVNAHTKSAVAAHSPVEEGVDVTKEGADAGYRETPGEVDEVSHTVQPPAKAMGMDTASSNTDADVNPHVTDLTTTATASSGDLASYEPHISTAASTRRDTFMAEPHESDPGDASSEDPSVAVESSADEEPVPVQQEMQHPEHDSHSSADTLTNEWVECISDAGDRYYYNARTHESRWTHPEEETQPAAQPESALFLSMEAKDALFGAVSGVEPFADRLEEILQSGASVDQVNNDNLTPLQIACQRNDVRAVSLLLYYGADANHSTSRTSSLPLFLACWNDNVAILQMLIDYGASLGATDSESNSILHAAIASQSRHTLQFLFGEANSIFDEVSNMLNRRNRDEETPLHVAVRRGDTDAIRALVGRGAAIDMEDSHGRTPLVLSIMENRVECAQLLQTAEVSEAPSAAHIDAGLAEAIQATGFAAEDAETDQIADLERLQEHIFQLASSTPAVRQAFGQYVHVVREQLDVLSGELQVRTCELVEHSSWLSVFTAAC